MDIHSTIAYMSCDLALSMSCPDTHMGNAKSFCIKTRSMKFFSDDLSHVPITTACSPCKLCSVSELELKYSKGTSRGSG